MRFATFALALSTLAVMLVGAMPQNSSIAVTPEPTCCPDHCIVCVAKDPCNPSLQIEYPLCGCAIQTTKCEIKKTGDMCNKMIKTCMGGSSFGGCELDNHFCLEECKSTRCTIHVSCSANIWPSHRRDEGRRYEHLPEYLQRGLDFGYCVCRREDSRSDIGVPLSYGNWNINFILASEV